MKCLSACKSVLWFFTLIITINTSHPLHPLTPLLVFPVRLHDSISEEGHHYLIFDLWVKNAFCLSRWAAHIIQNIGKIGGENPPKIIQLISVYVSWNLHAGVMKKINRLKAGRIRERFLLNTFALCHFSLLNLQNILWSQMSFTIEVIVIWHLFVASHFQKLLFLLLCEKKNKTFHVDKGISRLRWKTTQRWKWSDRQTDRQTDRQRKLCIGPPILTIHTLEVNPETLQTLHGRGYPPHLQHISQGQWQTGHELRWNWRTWVMMSVSCSGWVTRVLVHQSDRRGALWGHSCTGVLQRSGRKVRGKRLMFSCDHTTAMHNWP